ncbi:MAG: hypothetical protein H6560_27520 [Lewinellaceae bacterium]|nr:hypothetical protein [Lewinellaceae bacterium]
MQLFFLRLEVGCVVQEHPLDTNVAMPDGCCRIEAAVNFFLVFQDQTHRFPDERIAISGS